MPTIGTALAGAEGTLAAAGVESPRVDAEWMLAGILDVGRNALAVNARRPLGEMSATRYAEAVRRRARREPLQRILGWEEFRGLRFRLTREVLVPRPETELLVEWALEMLPSSRPGQRPLAVDVGTGSGCIACAVAHARPDVDVLALDVSRTAAATATANARALGLDSRVRVLVSDLAVALRSARADLMIANLPYLPDGLLTALQPEVSSHEPMLALAGGADGLDVVRRLIPDARRALRPGGAIVLETAGDAQAAALEALLRAEAFVDVSLRRDLVGVGRFVGARTA